MEMPRIRCPNCGLSINLENRKKIDIELIVRTLRSGPRTFTQILRATRLPRKTLSLRLKKLISSGTIVKDGGYSLNKSLRSGTRLRIKSKISRFIKENPDGNRDAILIAAFFVFLIVGPILFATTLPVYAHSIHKFDIQPQAIEESFTIKITVSDAVDLFAWQAKLTFDPNVLVVLDVAAGGFLSLNAFIINATGPTYVVDEQLLSEGDSIQIFAMDVGAGALAIGGSKIGDVPGVNGDGTLATITFGVRIGTQRTYDVNVEGGVILLNSHIKDAKGTLAIET